MPTWLWKLIDFVLAPMGLELVLRFVRINDEPERPGGFCIVRKT